ncbi:MAG: F0F1 ATP synthase subunit gamma, partial [Chloroflexi bacterium]|nr:F0F1 ATP synthase subunit gamma [Chloroflexota bacterium]
MASVRQIRRRIRSVENTAKITKAMSMIAASKMRRAQESALRGRPYSERIQSLLSDLAAQPQNEDTLHPLLQRRESKNIQVVIITPDRGLTGGLNSNINRTAARFILEQSAHVNIIAVGKKGRDFMAR